MLAQLGAKSASTYERSGETKRYVGPPAPPPPDRYPGASPLALAHATGVGNGPIHTPGLPCAQGGSGSSWHDDYVAPLPGGVFSSLAGTARFHLDVHSEGTGAPIATYSNGFLQGGDSRTVLENERGSLRLALMSGASLAMRCWSSSSQMFLRGFLLVLCACMCNSPP